METGRKKEDLEKLERSGQEKRLDYLLEEFGRDSVYGGSLKVPKEYGEKRRLLRSLMNIRMPGKMEEDILRVQDQFLREEAREKGIVSLDQIPAAAREGSDHPFAEQISVWQGDITRLKTDAIVNAANSQMLGCFVPCHGCIDNAIHSAAGIQLREDCCHYMNRMRMRYGRQYEEPVGQAVLTEGYNLPAGYVIHTVGPIVFGRLTEREKRQLQSCYENILKCCEEHGIRSVAFCCISTGEFHFPNDQAARIAVESVTSFLNRKGRAFDRIVFNVFKDVDRELYRKLLGIKVTVQPSNVPRGVTLHSQRDPEICGRQAAKIAACVHAFVTVKPEG